MTPASLPLRWIAAVLLLVVFPLTLWWVGSSAQDAAFRDLRERGAAKLDLYRFSLQGELQKFEVLPRILAEEAEVVQLVRDGDRQGRSARVSRFLERFNDIAGASDTYVMDRTGLTLAASNWNSPSPFVGERFAFRPYFQQALDGQAGRYHALGTTSQRRGYYFSYPISHHGEIVGVAAVKVAAERLEELLAHEPAKVIVTDAPGVIFLSTSPQWVFRTLRPLDQEAHAQLRASRQYGDGELRPLRILHEEYRARGTRLMTIQEPGASEPQPDGVDRAVTYLVQTTQVPYAGWIVHLLTDIQPVRSQVITQVVLVGVLMAVFVFALGFVYQRRVILLERIEFQRRAREASEESEANTRSLIRNTRAGLVTTAADGSVAFINPTAQDLFGTDSERVTGTPFRELLVPECRGEFDAWLQRARRAPEQLRDPLECEALHAGGSRFPVELAVSHMELKGVGRFLVTIHDLTERKRAEEALRRAHGELEERVRLRTSDLTEANRRLQEEIAERRRAEEILRQAQDELVQAGKLAAIGQMSAGITHELNQPLAAIRAYTDNARVLLERQRPEDAVSNLGHILELTDRMAQITAHLKSFARKSSGRAVPVALGEVIDRALQLLSSHTKLERFQIQREKPAAGEVWVLGDALRLEQVALNILKNAMDALAASEQRIIRIRIERKGGRGVLRVRDSGSGIAPEQLPNVFDPFFTTKDVNEGLGLGLSISMGIVREFGGTIRARNPLGGGCEFTIELPLAETGHGAATAREGTA